MIGTRPYFPNRLVVRPNGKIIAYRSLEGTIRLQRQHQKQAEE